MFLKKTEESIILFQRVIFMPTPGMSASEEKKMVLLNKKREGKKNKSLLSLKGITFIFSLWHSTHAIIIQGQQPPLAPHALSFGFALKLNVWRKVSPESRGSLWMQLEETFQARNKRCSVWSSGLTVREGTLIHELLFFFFFLRGCVWRGGALSCRSVSQGESWHGLIKTWEKPDATAAVLNNGGVLSRARDSRPDGFNNCHNHPPSPYRSAAPGSYRVIKHWRASRRKWYVGYVALMDVIRVAGA